MINSSYNSSHQAKKMEVRGVSGLECLQLFARCYLQMGIVVHDSKDVQTIIARIQKRCMGLRIKFEDNKLTSGLENPTLIEIPSSVKTIAEATTWMKENASFELEKSLGIIGTIANFIVLQLNHAMGDFRFGIELANDISQHESVEFSQLEGIPINPTQYFEQEILTHKSAKYYCANNPNISRLITTSTATEPSRFTIPLKFRIPIENIKYCDVTDLSDEKLFETQLAGLIISIAAINPSQNQYSMGCSIPINTRTVPNANKAYTEQYFKKYLTDDEKRNEAYRKFAYAYFLAYIDAFTKAQPNEKLCDVTKRIIQSFNKAKDAGEHFQYYSLMNKLLVESFEQGELPPGSGIELYYNGVIKSSDIIDDITLDTVVDGCLSCKWLSLISYCLITPSKSELCGTYYYMLGDSTEQEAAKFVKGFELCLTKLTPNNSISEAIEFVRSNL
ncbi:hypothetical protein TVAG_418760 [Trichomonas vaginalis G3]|uniref:Condensation domain-containing protein n=1 Tax=Trichomonas vaginalis (strain ATCC PRA-98 / G3) TaxID=412133 RepID=A2E7E6_TRIV3|nr:hypothetical protein TVAGG3_0832030 [Trichomonas vaginalis G3]EAY11439.1 hypothetical protein TVAG_418760 [Trichomonas vaginalis G3]KAI5498651.1 hypothetical protein TVAGG3_0832030 [Trichomonas vaginalis G3]|eukprot:XP_001323662.1 hypothetical protein [Trichomonas vaginalis G3]